MLRILIILAVVTSFSRTAAGTEQLLADSSLEDLMQIKVTSVSRKPQPLSRSAAAVYVITNEDIARSGAHSIPEILRLAPGLMVARIDSNKWSVSARGDAGRFANKMLVLIDGRTVYTSLYSGVYWEQNDTVIADIERIEIIRGPGGTMWGANAVNAVINIITKSAARTRGLLAIAGGGSQDRGFGVLRYGGDAGEDVAYRGYVKYFNGGPLLAHDGTSANDGWSSLRGGGRLEWTPSQGDHVVVHGDLYRGNARENVNENFLSPVPGRTLNENLDVSGGYALGRWEHTSRTGSETAFQSYIHQENRSEAMGKVNGTVVDFDFQHRTALGSRHDLLSGASYRVVHDRLVTGPLTAGYGHIFSPDSTTESLYSTFLQDDFTVIPDRLVLTAGTKLQHGANSGFELQPNVRALWTPSARQAFWIAISRAVRTPSRRDHDLLGLPFELPPPAPAGSFGVVQGNRDFASETFLSYEGGWRWQRGNRLSLDLTGYVGQAHGLQQLETGDAYLLLNPVRLILPMQFSNTLAEKRGGVELTSTVQISREWRVHANYSWYRAWDAQTEPGHQNNFFLHPAPYRDHQAQFRSSWDLRRHVALDVGIFAYSGLAAINVKPAVRADIRLAVRVGENAEWSVGFQDLLNRHRREFVSEDYIRSADATRAVYFKVIWGR